MRDSDAGTRFASATMSVVLVAPAFTRGRGGYVYDVLSAQMAQVTAWVRVGGVDADAADVWPLDALLDSAPVVDVTQIHFVAARNQVVAPLPRLAVAFGLAVPPNALVSAAVRLDLHQSTARSRRLVLLRSALVATLERILTLPLRPMGRRSRGCCQLQAVRWL